MTGAPDVLVRIVEARRARLAADPGTEPAPLEERAEVMTPEENPFLAALAEPSSHRPALRSPAGASRRAGAGPGLGPEPPDPDPSPYRPALRSPAGASRRAGAGPGSPAADTPTAAVIAEVKMGSPRIGSLAGRVDPEAQARLYADHGAAALSVVVEPDFFGGSYDLLARCHAASGLPAIAKDFVVDGRQLRWAKEAGADAVLLIAALHSAGELARWARRARALGLVPLIETHGGDDLAKLAAAGPDAWELVGVNNRDLRTFRVDLEHSMARLPELPAGALKVAESGIASGADVDRLATAGFDAFLVGESLLLADDPVAVLTDLVHRGRGAA